MQTCVLRSNSRPCAKEFETQASSLGFRGLFLCSLTLVATFLAGFTSSQSPPDDNLQPPPDVIVQPPPDVILEPPPGVILRPLPGDHEIDIRFVNGGGKEPLIQPASGWPLTLSLTANEEKLQRIVGGGRYPERDAPAVLVFEPEETRVEFKPGHHLPDDSRGGASNPRLPNLVVIADAGPGSGQADKLLARNLAGLFTSVAYELKDSRGRTSILAHMNVPRGLFPTEVLTFAETGEHLDASVLAWVDAESAVSKDRPSWRVVKVRDFVTIRAFVVKEPAPAEFVDVNGDGVVDITDARKDGLKLLSNEASLRVVQLRLPSGSGYLKRLDPGAIEDPPR